MPDLDNNSSFENNKPIWHSIKITLEIQEKLKKINAACKQIIDEKLAACKSKNIKDD